jgi:hypothetical protein
MRAKRLTGNRSKSESHPTGFPWDSIAKLGTAIVALVTPGVFVSGEFYRRTYLKTFGLDPAPFVRDFQGKLLDGGYALYSLCVRALGAADGGSIELLAWFLAFVAYLAFAGWTSDYVRQPTLRRSISDTVLTLKGKPWLQWPVKGMAWAFGSFALLGGLLLVITFFATSGVLAGQAAGQQALSRMGRGCDQPKDGCVALYENGQLRLRGTLIDSTESHLALFDFATKSAVILERNKLSVRTASPPAL